MQFSGIWVMLLLIEHLTLQKIITIMAKINFLPWIGEHYYKTGFAGKRILVLGESHYCQNVSDASEDITRRVIMDLLDPTSEHEAYKNTYTKFAQALLGRGELSFADKELFWNSVAFYNYVQVPMSGPRVAPTQDNFRNSETAFFEVIEMLRPDIIIVWVTVFTTTSLTADYRGMTSRHLMDNGSRHGDIFCLTGRK